MNFSVTIENKHYEVELDERSVTDTDTREMAKVNCTVNSKPLTFEMRADKISEPYDVAHAAAVWCYFNDLKQYDNE